MIASNTPRSTSNKFQVINTLEGFDFDILEVGVEIKGSSNPDSQDLKQRAPRNINTAKVNLLTRIPASGEIDCRAFLRRNGKIVGLTSNLYSVGFRSTSDERAYPVCQ